eukprot:7161188-Prymnesium_polylepis.2
MLGGGEALTGIVMRKAMPMPIKNVVALADHDLDDAREQLDRPERNAITRQQIVAENLQESLSAREMCVGARGDARRQAAEAGLQIGPALGVLNIWEGARAFARSIVRPSAAGLKRGAPPTMCIARTLRFVLAECTEVKEGRAVFDEARPGAEHDEEAAGRPPHLSPDIQRRPGVLESLARRPLGLRWPTRCGCPEIVNQVKSRVFLRAVPHMV